MTQFSVQFIGITRFSRLELKSGQNLMVAYDKTRKAQYCALELNAFNKRNVFESDPVIRRLLYEAVQPTNGH